MIPATQLRSMVHRQIRRFGDGLQITLRERSTLRTRVSGTPTNNLVLVGAASAGDTEIVAEAAGLVGQLPAGARVTIGGVEYTLDAAAQAETDTTQLTLTLTSALTGNLAAGSTIDVSQPYAETAYFAMRSRADQKEALDGVPDTARTYRLSAKYQTRRPKKGDVLIDSTGNATELVTAVTAAEPGGAASDAIYWTITVGSAK